MGLGDGEVNEFPHTEFKQNSNLKKWGGGGGAAEGGTGGG